MTLLNHHRYAVFFLLLMPLSKLSLFAFSFIPILFSVHARQPDRRQSADNARPCYRPCLPFWKSWRTPHDGSQRKTRLHSSKKKVSVSQGEVYFLLEFFLLFWTYNHKKERLNERTELQNKEIIGRLPPALCDFEVLPTCVVDIHGCRSDCHLCASN